MCFFGEGTLDVGAFYEAINFAPFASCPHFRQRKQSVCDGEPAIVRQAEGSDLCERVRAFKITSERVDGDDVAARVG
jgi:TPP-dependent pyruvate/acetoin dehydrogenase alpha subunit